MIGIPFIGKALGAVMNVVDKAVKDKDLATKIKGELQTMALTGQLKELEAAAAVIQAEAAGDSWLQRSWRPITMLVFVALIVAKWMGFTAPGISEAIESDILDVVKIGLGGYVVSRGVEKTAKIWKEKPNAL